MTFNVDSLHFPSGRSVGNCRKDAKSRARKLGLPLHQALDLIAFENGVSKPWHEALPELQSRAAQSSQGLLRVMTADDIQAILEKHWELTHFGIGVSPTHVRKAGGYGAAIRMQQTALINALEECNRACTFLQHVERRKTINPRAGSSYGLKHQAEAYLRRLVHNKPENAYVSNGAFICAATFMGFEYRRIGVSSPNAHFNMSSKSPVFVWAHLLSGAPHWDQTSRDKLRAVAAQVGASTNLDYR